jgi:hypothetical protein
VIGQNRILAQANEHKPTVDVCQQCLDFSLFTFANLGW